MTNELTNCPHCDANLVGEPIPEDIRKHFAGTHWRREIAIYDRSLDRTVEYKCPDCGKTWKRRY